MLIAALLVIPMLIIDQSGLGGAWQHVADVLNWGTWLAFVVELVVMLSVVPNRRSWLRDHPIDVIATVLTPPILPSPLASARALRLLRVLRLLRLGPLARRVFTITGVRYAALLTFMTLLIGGTVFAEVEEAPSEWDGIWWAASTMTTVGYGDLVPATEAGRVIALAVMFVGIGLGTLLIGAVARRFLDRDVQTAEAEEQRVLNEVRALHERLDRLERTLRAE